MLRLFFALDPLRAGRVPALRLERCGPLLVSRTLTLTLTLTPTLTLTLTLTLNQP